MGIFAARQRHANGHTIQTRTGEHLHVLARTQTSAGASRPLGQVTVWSFAAEQPATEHHFTDQLPQVKKSKSLFGIKTGPSLDKTASSASYRRKQTSSTDFVEFGLIHGHLHVSSTTPSIPVQQPWNDDNQDNDHSVLLKIKIPVIDTAMSTHQSLSTRVEQILHSVSATNSTLTDNDSKSWIRLALIALQHAGVLSQGSLFNVNNFMAYTENQLVELETEVSVASQIDDSDHSAQHHTREIDYQTHLDENARLRALLKRDSVPSATTEKSHLRSSRLEGDNEPHIQGGFGGGWWVSRPHADRDGHQRREQPDPYGGLM